MPTSTHTTPGDYIASELIAAKARGESFKKPELSAFIDIRIEEWAQKHPQPAIAVDSRLSKARLSIPPIPSDVTLYFQSIGYPISGEEFCDFYQQKGWLVGKAKMKDWQSACRNWKRSGWGKLTGEAKSESPRDYSKI